ncbi:MAG: RNA methyltransferase [Chloroflexi bacterium]|nr:RNA methyltransferase [Chloroflexota bacterium]MYD17511.1 RNA methyltransferase [Chloroflexota bacterium]
MTEESPTQRLTRARLRQLQQLRSAKGRREQRAFLIDGRKLVRDAIEAEASIADLLSVSPEEWDDVSLPTTRISQTDAERLSDTRTPQGHFAVVEDRIGQLEPPSDDDWQMVALDAIQDAGNVGGIIRSSAAFGVAGVIVGPGSADPAHPRVTRAATGAWFRVPIGRSEDLPGDLAALRDAGATVLATEAAGEPLSEVQIPGRVVWLFGNEGSGISPALEPLIDHRVSVPISGSVESLNVGVAAGIILHHGWRAARERIDR